jgi:hypothetical protein
MGMCPLSQVILYLFSFIKLTLYALGCGESGLVHIVRYVWYVVLVYCVCLGVKVQEAFCLLFCIFLYGLFLCNFLSFVRGR